MASVCLYFFHFNSMFFCKCSLFFHAALIVTVNPFNLTQVFKDFLLDTDVMFYEYFIPNLKVLFLVSLCLVVSYVSLLNVV